MTDIHSPDLSDHRRRLERMYLGAPCNRDLAPTIAIAEGCAEVQFAVRPDDHFHAAGALHGAFYFKALDDAAFFAASSLVPESFVVTASLQVQLLRPVVDGSIRAVGRVVKPGRTVVFADAIAYDDADREIARASGVFAVGRTPLADVPGYADDATA